jgi:hypothetical protein
MPLHARNEAEIPSKNNFEAYRKLYWKKKKWISIPDHPH